MRDLTRREFNSNNPARNYVVLTERIDELQTRIRKMEQEMLEFHAAR